MRWLTRVCISFPYDRAGRRQLARWPALGGVPGWLLPAGARALAPVPPVVPGEAGRGPPSRPPEVLRQERGHQRGGLLACKKSVCTIAACPRQKTAATSNFSFL